MRIVLLLESAELWGGVKTALQDAEGLVERGHDVTVLCKGPAPDWMEVQCEFRTVPTFDAAHVPAADLVIGTFWTTVPFAATCGRGIPVHYCQGYEGDNPESAAVRQHIEAVYELPIAKVTISGHLERLLAERFGVTAHRIDYAIDDAVMFPGRERAVRHPTRIGLVGPYGVTWKDIRTGLRACAIAHAAGLLVQAVRASNVARHADEVETAFPVEWHERVPPRAMGDFYRSLDVFAATSSGAEEGFFMPAVEAMACGIPCVLTDIPCARDYDDAHDYALFVPPGDPLAMARAFVQVAGDPDVRRRLRAAGLRVAARYSRHRHLADLEAALFAIAGHTPDVTTERAPMPARRTLRRGASAALHAPAAAPA